ncbi:ATP-binding protein [Actinomycetospora sp. CA-053990]|uniref:sensor histidine kinase n=1 Tax=Actinomycetospora sp. CA-053990 TaxID=3239891 RepID=UPI003D8C37CD
MNLRTRLALSFALVAAVVAGLVGVLSFHAASDRVIGEIDTQLRSATTAIASGQTQILAPVPASRSGDAGGGRGGGGSGGDGDGGRDGDGPRIAGRQLVAQAVTADGAVQAIGGLPVTLPITDAERSLAASGTAGDTQVVEVDVGSDTFRVLTTALGDGRGALQVAADVDEAEDVLTGVAIEIALVSLGVLVVAAAAGWLLAWRITRRLKTLVGVAEQVTASGELDLQVPVGGKDEVGRLSASLNTMLDRLAAARADQERLVQDAAHELRTPLTSLRTNASVMRRFAALSPTARDRLVDDVVGETRELSHLVDELVELSLSSRGPQDRGDEPVDLAEAAEHAAERVRRRTGRQIHVDGDGSVVRGSRHGLGRAISNLVENAAKFDADGHEPIHVNIRNGVVTVTDQGPGIAAGDAHRVFDRFYRADVSRGLPGSGLGLSIVREVAESHGGSPFVADAPDGGARVGFSVDPSRLSPTSATT